MSVTKRVWVRCGSVIVEETGGHNMRISMSHTPSNAVTIERADIDDLRTAMEEWAEKRSKEGG